MYYRIYTYGKDSRKVYVAGAFKCESDEKMERMIELVTDCLLALENHSVFYWEPLDMMELS